MPDALAERSTLFVNTLERRGRQYIWRLASSPAEQKARWGGTVERGAHQRIPAHCPTQSSRTWDPAPLTALIRCLVRALLVQGQSPQRKASARLAAKRKATRDRMEAGEGEAPDEEGGRQVGAAACRRCRRTA